MNVRCMTAGPKIAEKKFKLHNIWCWRLKRSPERREA
jgi:hypothetical protein